MAITLISIVLLIRDIYAQRKRLNEIVSKNNAHMAVRLCRGKWTSVPACSLVPGDLIQITTDHPIIPADCCITRGEMVVDESMLTGESVPATKLPLTHGEDFAGFTNDNLNFIHAGTEVVQARDPRKE